MNDEDIEVATDDVDPALLAEIGGAVVRAIRKLAADEDLSGSVFTVMDRTAGLATVRVSLRKPIGDDDA